MPTPQDKSAPSSAQHTAPVVVVGHGSRAASSQSEFKSCLKRLTKQLPGRQVLPAYVELESPLLADRLLELGASHTQIDLLSIFLFDASHTLKDIPEAIATAQGQYPELRVRRSASLGNAPGLASANQRALAGQLEALGLRAEDCELLVVGRGASKPLAKSQFEAAVRAQAGTLAWQQVSHAYISMSEPRLESYLDGLYRDEAPARHLLVLPILVFHGRLLESVDTQLVAVRERAAARGLKVVRCPHLAASGALEEALGAELRKLELSKS